MQLIVCHAYAGVWMYGGVADIADQPMSYTYGDNIYFDVRSLLAMHTSSFITQVSAESESSAFLGHWHHEIGVDVRTHEIDPTKDIVSPQDGLHWAHGHLCGAQGHNVLHEKMSLSLQLAPEAEAEDAPEQNYYVYVIPQYHLPGIFW